MAASSTDFEALVQIVGPTDQWVLERQARKLARKLPYAEFVPWKPRPCPTTRIAYYVNYALYQGPSGYLDVGFFTHEDPAHGFLERARQVELCVSMSRKYADWLKEQGVQQVVHIPMGCDILRYRPRLVLGVIGRLDHPRKGKHLVDRLQSLPFVEIVATEGQIADSQLREVYQRLDYVLIPATIEGGPMSLLEGLSMGKPVIAPAGVGITSEFSATPYVRTYRAGDPEDLERLVQRCFEEKTQASQLVAKRSWDDWAAAHHAVFMDLLRQKGLPCPDVGPRFRFGLIHDLPLPKDGDLEDLDSAIDAVAKQLFFGREREAKTLVEDLVARFECARPLLTTFGGEPGNPKTSGEAPERAVVSSVSPRILLIAHIETLRDRMDKSHYYRYQALARRPGVVVFGPGIAGYRKGMSIEEAIATACGGEAPDLIVHGGDLRDSGLPLVGGLNRIASLKAVELLDTWAQPQKIVNFIRSQGFEIGLMQEAGPHLDFFRRSCPGTEFYWTPNGVNLDLFQDYGLPKESDVIIYGMLEPNIYPFRCRLAELLSTATDLRIRHIRHPGYYPHLEGTTEPIIAGAALGRAINQAWIGIATRSIYQCLLMKHLEIAACGTLIAGNVPDWHRPAFEGSYLELREDQTDEEILAAIRNCLADKAKLTAMARRAQRPVKRDYTTETFADLVIAICRERTSNETT
jgi:Glycosyl transferases group 1